MSDLIVKERPDKLGFLAEISSKDSCRCFMTSCYETWEGAASAGLGIADTKGIDLANRAEIEARLRREQIKRDNANNKSHVFGSVPNGCWCGTYHYICADCGSDCTAGTSKGPCYTDTNKRSRCYECNGIWERLRGALSPWSPEEVDTVRVALQSIGLGPTEDTIVPTEEQRKLAGKMLDRSERRTQ